MPGELTETHRLWLMFLCGLGTGWITSWWVFWYIVSRAVSKPDA
jgi:hypothetical protein